MRPSIFGASTFGVAAIVLALTGCGTTQPQDTPPQQQIARPQPAPQQSPGQQTPAQQNPAQQTGPSATQSAQTSATSGSIADPPDESNTLIIPVPGVPTVAPPPEGSPVTRQPYVYSPGPSVPTTQYSQPLNRGPVTGYGPGGLAQPPGAPSNPPFHYAP
jgi:predicted small lipoprotein YifL